MMIMNIIPRDEGLMRGWKNETETVGFFFFLFFPSFTLFGWCDGGCGGGMGWDEWYGVGGCKFGVFFYIYLFIYSIASADVCETCVCGGFFLFLFFSFSFFLGLVMVEFAWFLGSVLGERYRYSSSSRLFSIVVMLL